MRPRLARSVTFILSDFGDVDDLVARVLDESYERCAQKARVDTVNRKFMTRVVWRRALTKKKELRRQQEARERLRQCDEESGGCGPAGSVAEATRDVCMAAMALGSGDRKVFFAILRQMREYGCIVFKDLARDLGCSEWKARKRTERCFARIRAFLRAARSGDGPWF